MQKHTFDLWSPQLRTRRNVDVYLPESYDDLMWDAVPVDRAAPAPAAVEAPADPEPVPVHTPYTPPAADEPPRPVTLHVEQSDVG